MNTTIKIKDESIIKMLVDVGMRVYIEDGFLFRYVVAIHKGKYFLCNEHKYKSSITLNGILSSELCHYTKEISEGKFYINYSDLFSIDKQFKYFVLAFNTEMYDYKDIKSMADNKLLKIGDKDKEFSVNFGSLSDFFEDYEIGNINDYLNDNYIFKIIHVY